MLAWLWLVACTKDDSLVCGTGTHEEDGACVPDEGDTDSEDTDSADTADTDIGMTWHGDTVGYYDRSTGTWNLRNENSAGTPDVTFSFGPSTDFPLVGDWDGL